MVCRGLTFSFSLSVCGIRPEITSERVITHWHWKSKPKPDKTKPNSVLESGAGHRIPAKRSLRFARADDLQPTAVEGLPVWPPGNMTKTDSHVPPHPYYVVPPNQPFLMHASSAT